MADHTFEPLIRFEDLFFPLEPAPPNLPVCKRTHEHLLHSLDVLQANVRALRIGIEQTPRLDAFIDGLRGNVAQSLEDAGNAYATFLETRDCEGEA